MNRTITTSVIVFVTLLCSNAFAIEQLVHVSPNATTFHVELQQEDRMVRFTIVHDPKDVAHPSNEPLRPTRTAQLRISDENRLILTAPIAPRVNKDGMLVYEFRVLEEHARHASLTVSENLSGFVGDGTIYNYSKSGTPEILRELIETQNKATDTPPSTR
ncbi:MAG: hypothetical protein R3C01_17490 [Planctomycetaceae bacterium]